MLGRCSFVDPALELCSVAPTDSEHRKPHPAPLLHALAHFNVKANHAVMIGDSRNDIEAARAAGMPCIAVRYGYNHGEPISYSEPDLVLDSLVELL